MFIKLVLWVIAVSMFFLDHYYYVKIVPNELSSARSCVAAWTCLCAIIILNRIDESERRR